MTIEYDKLIPDHRKIKIEEASGIVRDATEEDLTDAGYTPKRRVFYVDVGDMSPEEATKTIEEIRKKRRDADFITATELMSKLSDSESPKMTFFKDTKDVVPKELWINVYENGLLYAYKSSEKAQESRSRDSVKNPSVVGHYVHESALEAAKDLERAKILSKIGEHKRAYPAIGMYFDALYNELLDMKK